MSNKMSFSEMRKQSSNLEQLQTKLKQKSYAKDERLWRAEQDKAGNAQAIIRFLPAPPGEDVPYVKLLSFFFNENGKYFVENSPRTIGLECPVHDANDPLWNGTEQDKAVARKRKATKKYYSNIYVVKDPANPENEGKVFLFQYGQKIFEKIESSIVPKFEGDDPVNPFDLDRGANFKLRIVKKDGYANYDNSTFEAPSKLLDDDAELERIWNSQYSLQEFVSPDNFKSYDELKTKLETVIGSAPTTLSTQTIEDNVDDEVSSLTATEPTLQEDTDETLSSIEDIDMSADSEDLADLKSLVK